MWLGYDTPTDNICDWLDVYRVQARRFVATSLFLVAEGACSRSVILCFWCDHHCECFHRWTDSDTNEHRRQVFSAVFRAAEWLQTVPEHGDFRTEMFRKISVATRLRYDAGWFDDDFTENLLLSLPVKKLGKSVSHTVDKSIVNPFTVYKKTINPVAKHVEGWLLDYFQTR